MDFVMWANNGVYIIIPAVQVKHTFFPKMFFPVYPIVDTGFVNYDSFFFPFFFRI